MYVDKVGKVTISSLQPLELAKEIKDPYQEWEKISMVLGYASCNETSKTYSVKLYEVHKIHHSIGSLTKFKYRSSNSFLSSKYDSDIGNLLFNTLMLNSNRISSWLPATGFKYDYKDSSVNYSVNQIYSQPKEIHLFKNDEYNIYFYFRASSGHKEKRASYIKEQVFLNVETQEQLHPKELYKLKAIIERLFSIIFFEPIGSTITEIRNASGNTYRDLNKIKELLGSQSVPVDFEIFLQNSQNIFKYWFQNQERFELFIKNFFSVYGQNGVLAENRFLTYISILENYHKNNVQRTATLKERLSFILENSCLKDTIVDIDKYSEKVII